MPHTARSLILTLIVSLFTSTTSNLAQNIIYVSAEASSPGNGQTWATALGDLQPALDLARNATNLVSEIWVAEGTYVADGSETNDRTRAFDLVSGVTVRGGFVGDETSLSQREVRQHPTILSGDLFGDDDPPFLIPCEVAAQDNSIHVVRARYLAQPTAIDGFIITGGAARGPVPTTSNGGGLYAEQSTVVISNCMFLGNQASNSGGAVFVIGNADVRILNCVFRGNQAAIGGALAATTWSNVLLVNAVLEDNVALESGGGIFHVLQSSTSLVNCTIHQNSAGAFGTGLYAPGETSNTGIDNSIFWGNQILELDIAPLQYDTDHQELIHVGASCVAGLPGGYDSNGNTGDDPHLMPFEPDNPLNNAELVGSSAWGRPLPGPLSPCLDHGDSMQLTVDIADVDADGDSLEQLPIDLAGRPRRTDLPDHANGLLGSSPHIDMGALERQASDPVVCNHNPLTHCCRPDTGTLSVLDDRNPCTSDSCDNNGIALHLANTFPCDDEMFCNGSEICSASNCVSTGNPCSAPGLICNESRHRCDCMSSECLVSVLSISPLPDTIVARKCGVSQIEIRFSEDVVLSGDDFQLENSLGNELPLVLDYSVATATAHLTPVNPFPNKERFYLTIGDNIASVATGVHLSSGAGELSFGILIGDSNHSGLVTIADVITVRNVLNANAATYPQMDVNCSGVINIADMITCVNHLNDALPPE